MSPMKSGDEAACRDLRGGLICEKDLAPALEEDHAVKHIIYKGKNEFPFFL